MAQLYNYPSGIILLFEASCPSGWTRVSAADGKLIKFDSSYGTSSSASSHTHSVPARVTTIGATDLGSVTAGSDYSDVSVARISHRHTFTRASGVTGSAATTPEYIDVILCVKD